MIKERDKTAISIGRQHISYGQLLMNITAASDTYAAQPGDRIMIVSENRLGWIYAFYSIWNKQAVAVPVDATSSAAEIAYVIDDCGATAVWASADRMDTVAEAVAMARTKPRILPVADVEAQSADAPKASLTYSEADLALIVYTSGTTGSPKGVMLSYRNLMANIRAVSEEVKIFTPEICTMILLPLHHVLPLIGSLVAPLATGGSVAMAPSLAAADIMSTLVDNKVGIIIGVPRLYATLFKGIHDKISKSLVARSLFALAEAVGSRSLSRLLFRSVRAKMGGHIKYLVSGGAALNIEVGRGFKTLGLDVLEGYGMTEAAPMIAFTRPDEICPGVSGKPMPSVQIDIRDGEICAKGDNIMIGYYNRPDETAQVLRDGWLHTGDLGYINKRGQVVITGRRKEIIVLSNGKNINPAEIEEKLEHYAAFVKEVGVFADKDQLRAIIVPNPDAARVLTDAELNEKIKWEVVEPYNRTVSPYKKVMNFSIFRGDLPRTKLDKLQRYRLPQLLDEAAPEPQAATPEPDTEEYRILRDFIADEKNCTVRPTDHIELDLGLDSLDKVGLQVFIQSSFGMEISSDTMVSFRDVAHMARYVAEQKTKIEVEKIDWKHILRERVSLQLPKSWLTGRLFVKMSKPILHLYFGLKGKGLNNIPEGPVIIAPNHQSFLDGIFVAALLKWNTIKNTYFYAKEQHVRRPFFKSLANRHNVIVMDMSNLKDSIQKLGEALRKKKNLIIFPEGTRTSNGSLGEFKKTFAILSAELNVPIVPVSITGAYDAMPRGRIIPRPFTKVMVEFLEPIYPRKSSYESLVDSVYSCIKRKQQMG